MATIEPVVQADPERYVWWFPGSPVKVHLDLKVVRQLNQRLAGKGIGASGTGLLFGRIQDGVTEILDFQPATGPTVASAVEALKGERERSLIGYYRTEEGGTFHLNAQDRSLAEQCFPKPHQVSLVIHYNGFGPPNATFFFRDKDGRMADFAFLEFPFDPSLLAIEERDRIQRSHPAIIEQPVSSSLATNSPVVNSHPKRSLLRRSLGWIGSLAVIFALGIAFRSAPIREQSTRIWRAVLFSFKTAPASATQPSHASIALHAIRQNSDLELTWNGESSLIAAASSSVVSIQDGQSKRIVSLDSAQLRGGSLLYSPTTDQVTMELAITTPDGVVTAAVTAVLPKTGQETIEPSPVPTAPSQRVPPVKASRTFVAPSLPKGDPSSDAPVLQEPPMFRITPLVPAAVPEVLAQTPQAPSLLSQQRAATVTTYEPAVAVVKTSPVVASELRNLIVRKTTVQVKVTVDALGIVTRAEAIPEANTPKFLLNAASVAARSWRFRPARHDHEPVPSEAILQFIFSR
jgi:hypothetical protein